MPEPVILAQGLTRRFGDFTAVDGVHLAVAAGEAFGLLGANGAGKTTTLRMLCGLLEPTSGSIRVAGIDMVHHPRLARGRIGYVAQGFALYRELTVRENLEVQGGLYGLRRRQVRERIADAMAHLGIEAFADAPAGTLPLGIRRRLDLAAALLHGPDVLFLDEPTSGIDPLARQRLWELFYGLSERGIALLVTTHYMDEAAYCDRLALMHAGRIIAEGSPEALLARPLPSPILEVRGGSAALMSELRGLPQVREIIPRAGAIRVRLEPGADVQGLMARLRGEGAEVLEAAPDLEDVFVSLIGP